MDSPPCPRCRSVERQHYLGRVPTDFGGEVHVWVCQMCGVSAILCIGERPEISAS